MSLVTVHLRWNDVGSEQQEHILAAAPGEGRLPAGCFSRQLRRQGSALLATEVWDSEAWDSQVGDSDVGDSAAGGLDQLPRIVREVGVAQAPQSVMFAVPAMFAVAYRRTARPAAVPVPVPRQPGAPAAERLPVAPAPTGAVVR